MNDQTEIDETLPEVVKAFLRKGAKLQNITLTERGEWKHEGLDFENQKVIDLFNRSVGRTEGGTWVLEVGVYTYPIVVERTGFFVERVSETDAGVSLFLSDGTQEPLDASTLVYEPEGRLFTRVKTGAFEARFKKPAYYAMAEYMHEEGDQIIVTLPGGTRAVLQG